MATLEAWLDVETEVERVFAVYLGTTLGLTVKKSDSDADLTVPRIDIVAMVHQMGPHRMIIASGTYANRQIYDQFVVTLGVDLTFSPFAQVNISATPTAAAYRGSLRRCLSDWDGIQSAFASGGLLYLARDTIRQIDGNRSIDSEAKTETITTKLSAGVFLIPTVVPT